MHDVRHVGEVTLRVEPATRGEGTSFHVAAGLNTIPPEFISAVEQGAQEATLRGGTWRKRGGGCKNYA